LGDLYSSFMKEQNRSARLKGNIMANRMQVTRCLLVSAVGAVLLWANGTGKADDKKPLTAEQVRELQAKFQSERDAIVKAKLAEKFAPEMLQGADQQAKKGEAALGAGRLVEANDAYREARWLLPAVPADFPDHVARVFGNPRMRHADRIDDLSFTADG